VTRRYISSSDLTPRVEKGEVFAVARLISRAEVGEPEAREAIGAIYRKAGRAHVVGITGVPGSGKSTLVGKLVEKLRAQGLSIAIVAIDPSSPYSGGSILGDRIRMSNLALDPASSFVRWRPVAPSAAWRMPRSTWWTFSTWRASTWLSSRRSGSGRTKSRSLTPRTPRSWSQPRVSATRCRR
jgi:hypothetical protein